MSKKSVPAVAKPAADAAAFSVAEALGIPANATPEELLDLAVTEYNAAGLRMARCGAALIALREASKRLDTDFQTMVEARGIGRTHAYNAIALAEYLGTLPEAEAQRMLKAGYTKVLALAKADPEVVADLLEEGALDGPTPLSVRELVNELMHRRKNEQQKDKTIARLDGELEKAKSEASLRAADPLRAAKVEAGALCLTVDSLVEQLEAIADAQALPQLVKQHAAARGLAGVIFHGLAASVARASVLLKQLQDHYPEQLDVVEHTFEWSLAPDQVKALATRRAELLRQVESERALRAMSRGEGDAPRPRGRPRKNAA